MARIKRIILIGPMGAGKTSVGMRLAALLNFEFIDTDLVIQQQEQADINNIFLSNGEQYFRQQESKILATSLANNNIIIATGGGSILSALNRNIMAQHGLVFYLKTSLDMQIARLRSNLNRPLLPMDLDKKIDYLTTTMQTRNSLYESIADYVLDTDGVNIDELAESAYHYCSR